jgi:hypothetical protein
MDGILISVKSASHLYSYFLANYSARPAIVKRMTLGAWRYGA